MKSLACIGGSPRWSTSFQNVSSVMPHLMRLVLLRRTLSAVAIPPQSPPSAFQPCRRIIILEQLRILWFTYRIRLKGQKECRYIRKTIQPQLRNPSRSSGSTASTDENSLVRSTIVRSRFRAGLSDPVTLGLLPYKSSAEDSS